ncbi:MAG: nitroreductase family protein [Nitrososphaeria archaeon]
MECIEAILSRRSIRKLAEISIDKETVELLLRAAASAPSAHNLQPWEFIAVDDKRIIESLAELLRSEYIKSGLADENKAKKTYSVIRSASLIIIGLLNLTRLRDISPLEKTMGIQSLAAAAENILLAAHCLGLAAHWRAVPLARPDIFRSLFNVPDNVEPQWMIVIGAPAGRPREKPVRSDVFHFNQW